MSQQIFVAIPKIMAEIGHVGKNKNNSMQGYKFRGIDDMYNAIQPALIRNGVFCCPQITDGIVERIEGTRKDGSPIVSFHAVLKVNHKFYAADGSFVEVLTIGEALDQSDKAANKAMSAAMKYAFMELFSIPTEEQRDSEDESPTVTDDIPAKNHNLNDFGSFGSQRTQAKPTIKTPGDFGSVASAHINTPEDMPPLPQAKPVSGLKPTAKKFL